VVNTVAFTLPPAYRPLGLRAFVVDSNTALGIVTVATNGDVTPAVGNTPRSFSTASRSARWRRPSAAAGMIAPGDGDLDQPALAELRGLHAASDARQEADGIHAVRVSRRRRRPGTYDPALDAQLEAASAAMAT
jgi:hypothetical protein